MVEQFKLYSIKDSGLLLFCAGNIHYKLNEYGEEVEVADFLCIESSDLHKNYKPGIVYTEHTVSGLIEVDISISNYMYLN